MRPPGPPALAPPASTSAAAPAAAARLASPAAALPPHSGRRRLGAMTLSGGVPGRLPHGGTGQCPRSWRPARAAPHAEPPRASGGGPATTATTSATAGTDNAPGLASLVESARVTLRRPARPSPGATAAAGPTGREAGSTAGAGPAAVAAAAAAAAAAAGSAYPAARRRRRRSASADAADRAVNRGLLAAYEACAPVRSGGGSGGGGIGGGRGVAPDDLEAFGAAALRLLRLEPAGAAASPPPLTRRPRPSTWRPPCTAWARCAGAQAEGGGAVAGGRPSPSRPPPRCCWRRACRPP